MRGGEVRFIIPVIVGAIIGYITNWLAIKMLFRPYEEKKFLGISVPFTPGLIPKEKSRIAHSVGKTIGEYLLSPEIIIDTLSKEKIDDYIKLWVESNINKLAEEDRSIKAFIMDLKYENVSRIFDLFERKTTESICFKLREDSFQQKAIYLVEEYIFNRLDDTIPMVVNEKLKLLLDGVSSSDEMRRALEELIYNRLDQLSNDERTLQETVPENIICEIKAFIDEHNEDIVNILRNLLEDPVMEFKIKESINIFVQKNVSKAITIFISPEIISEKIFKAIVENLDNPEVNKNIASIVTSVFDKLLEIKVKNISTSISEKVSYKEISNISKGILIYITNEDNKDKILNIIDKKIKFHSTDIKNSISGLLSREFKNILTSETLYDNVYLIVHDSIEDIISRPVSSFVENIDEISMKNIVSFIKNIFNDFIMSKLPNIIELFNISKVVEDQINSFDVAFAEELIVEIANKELKAITWLGALLGGIMGILSPLLQMIN